MTKPLSTLLSTLLIALCVLCASLHAQVPIATLNIGWDAVAGAAGYRVTIDGITQDVGNPPSSASCTCPSVSISVVPATTHSISVLAYNALGTSALSSPLVLPSSCIAGRGLTDCWATTASPLQWSTDNVGFVNPPGQSVVVGGYYTISAGGLVMSGVQDGFYFLHQSSGGNGSLSTRILSIGPAGKAGLDWREDITAISRHVSLALTSANTLEMTIRSVAGTVSRVVATTPGITSPVYLRIVRAAGNSFTASRSSDGVVWTTVGTAVVPMAVGTRIGLFSLGASSSTAMTSQFSNVTKVP